MPNYLDAGVFMVVAGNDAGAAVPVSVGGGTNIAQETGGNLASLVSIGTRRTTLVQTGKSAANTTQTITLPIAGSGIYHWIESIYIARSATAALAGTATLDYTSTNMNGWALTVGNAMAAGGTVIDYMVTFGRDGMRVAGSNTVTTIIIPACGAAVLSRVVVTYYVAAA